MSKELQIFPCLLKACLNWINYRCLTEWYVNHKFLKQRLFFLCWSEYHLDHNGRKDTSYWDKTVILWQSESGFFSEIFQQCRALEHIFLVQNKVTSNIQWSMSNLTLKGTREMCQRDQGSVSKGPGKCVKGTREMCQRDQGNVADCTRCWNTQVLF